MGRALRPDEEAEWKKLQSTKPARKAKQPPLTRRDDDPQYHVQDDKPDAQRRSAIKKD